MNQKGRYTDDFKGLMAKYFGVEPVSRLEELVKKALNDHRGKVYLEKAYRKLYGSAKNIAEELELEIEKGRLKKQSLDEKTVNIFIQYYALDHGITLDEKLSWHSCRI